MSDHDKFYTGSDVSRHLPAGERSWRRGTGGPCSICGKPTDRPRNQTCSRSCWAIAYSQNAEAKYNLKAFSGWSSDMAYALGLMFSDGSVGERPSGSWGVQFCNTDLETVKWLAAYLGGAAVTTSRYSEDSYKEGGLRYSLSVTSRTLGDQLVGLGCEPRKSFKDIPFPQVPDEWLASFLRGFFDGDGGIWIAQHKSMSSGRLTLSLTSKPVSFREGLRQCLEAQGIVSSEQRISLRVSGASAEKLCLLMYEGRGPCMARKRVVWDNWVATRGGVHRLIVNTDPHEALRGLQPKPWHKLVGTRPDKEVAKVAGVSSSQVFLVRKALGFPPIRAARSPQNRPWHDLAGTMTDANVARLGGISKSMVCMYRKKAGIPSFRTQKSRVA